LKTYSLSRRITIGLTVTILFAGLSSFGWLYLKTKWTDLALREQTLLDQARVIASYLKLDGSNSITLNLPPRLAEAYSNPESLYRYAIRDESGQYLFDSGAAVAPLAAFSRSRRKLYDYDPDGHFVCLGPRCGLKSVNGQSSFKSNRKSTILIISEWRSSTSSSQMAAGL
jgi:hypothetical protein